MSSTTHRAGDLRIAAAVVGALIWLDAAALRLLFRADADAVYLLGRKIAWVCSMRSRFGLPCPTCGLTRGVVLSLQGDWGRAWQVAPGGPVAVAGLLALATALLAVAMVGRKGWYSPLRRAALMYGAGAVAVWIGGWVVHFSAALAKTVR
jgi:hypothetical protein